MNREKPLEKKNVKWRTENCETMNEKGKFNVKLLCDALQFQHIFQYECTRCVFFTFSYSARSHFIYFFLLLDFQVTQCLPLCIFCSTFYRSTHVATHVDAFWILFLSRFYYYYFLFTHNCKLKRKKICFGDKAKKATLAQ